MGDGLYRLWISLSYSRVAIRVSVELWDMYLLVFLDRAGFIRLFSNRFGA